MSQSPFLKERLEQNERIALFTLSNTRVILSLWKSDPLFLRVGFAPFWREKWKLDYNILFTFFGFAFYCSSCSFKKSDKSNLLFQKEWQEQFALLKKRQEQVALLKRVKRVKRVICSFRKSERAISSFLSKNNDSQKKNNEWIPNPDLQTNNRDCR